MLTDLTDPLAIAGGVTTSKQLPPTGRPLPPLGPHEQHQHHPEESVGRDDLLDLAAVDGHDDLLDLAAVEAAEVRELPPRMGLPYQHRLAPALTPQPLLGLPWKVGGALRPMVCPSLSRWQPTDGGRPTLPSAPSHDGPRLCVACMLRAAPLPAVDGFLRYYHAIGFERVVLFFDKPEEDAEAIAIARAHDREVGGVTIHLCDASWWRQERATGRTFVRARAFAESESRHCEDGAKVPFNFKYLSDQTTVHLFEETGDVQTRQCLVMDRALRDAWAAGFDWLLQLDIDELLYLPRAAHRHDARAFFASVGAQYDRVAFHNHEVMPCESLEVADWFGECSYFKVSPKRLADHADAQSEVDLRQRLSLQRDGEDIEPYSISVEPGAEAGNRVLSEVMAPLARVREPAIKMLHAMGLQLPNCAVQAAEAAKHLESQALRRIARDDDQRNQLWAQNRKRADEVAGGGAKGRDLAALDAARLQKEALGAMSSALAGATLVGKVDTLGVGQTYFNAHCQGKQATRLRAIYDPPRGGIHVVGDEGRTARTLTCVEPHDPAVLRTPPWRAALEPSAAGHLSRACAQSRYGVAQRSPLPCPLPPKPYPLNP